MGSLSATMPQNMIDFARDQADAKHGGSLSAYIRWLIEWEMTFESYVRDTDAARRRDDYNTQVLLARQGILGSI